MSPDRDTASYEIAGPARFGLISDTHVFDNGARRIPDQVLNAFVRMAPTVIVHCGDVATPSVITRLGDIAPVIAVRGNNDRGNFGRSLPEVARIDCAGKRLLVVHGDGGRSAKAVADELSAGMDCVIYGHSHIPDARTVRGTLVLNPGSPNDRRWHPHFGIGMLDVAATGLSPRLIVFSDPVELDGVALAPLAPG